MISSTFDATQTRKVENLYKVVSWYDNEWGFSNRMLDTTIAMMQHQDQKQRHSWETELQSGNERR